MIASGKRSQGSVRRFRAFFREAFSFSYVVAGDRHTDNNHRLRTKLRFAFCTARHFSNEQDHQNMMDQLGIKALRPGPSGDEAAPNHANYDESTANPYPQLPDPLVMNDGEKVTTAKQWWEQRRPEIVAMYEDNVYGHIPDHLPAVTWTVKTIDHETVGFHPVIAKDMIGRVDNSSYPAISVNIHMTLVTPANAKGPVPVLIMFGRAGFPNPTEPTGDDQERINQAWKAVLIQKDPGLKDVIAKYPAWEPVKSTPFQFPQLDVDGGFPPHLAVDCGRVGFRTARSRQHTG